MGVHGPQYEVVFRCDVRSCRTMPGEMLSDGTNGVTIFSMNRNASDAHSMCIMPAVFKYGCRSCLPPMLVHVRGGSHV